ncbi:hypothetical protein [Marinoscillum sp. MHG1-6]|uniref:hypothetical protein n=1 Tax=Marinoscillum sp. MHG1-6 TaxID=2959627 RepID=UPI00215868E9|nr:hypothetical protein [Marinoscillum sp. MHG1-6]
MNPNTLKKLSYVGLTIVMIVSLWYSYKSYSEGDPKYNFVILGFGIAILLGINLLKKREY